MELLRGSVLFIDATETVCSTKGIVVNLRLLFDSVFDKMLYWIGNFD